MLFFDEKSVLQMLERYSEKPQFRNFFKRKIQEILEESDTSPKTAKASKSTNIDRSYIKGIVKEVIEEQKLKKSSEAATKVVERWKLSAFIFGIVSLIRKQNILLLSLALFVVFLVLGYIFKSEILWIIALIFVLVIIWISYSWKVTHREIFGKKKHII